MKRTPFKSDCNSCILNKTKGPFIGKINGTENFENIDVLILGDFIDKNDYLEAILNETNFKEIKYYECTLAWCEKNCNRSEIENLQSFDSCKPNWSSIITKCKPSVIIALGQNVMNALGIDLPIQECIGKLHLYQEFLVFPSYHISDLNNKEEIKNHFLEVKSIIKEKKELKPSLTRELMYAFELPDWCYDSNHILIDIQMLKKRKEVLFIFRDQFENKKYHTEHYKNNYFYTMDMASGDAPIVCSVDEVKLRKDKKGLIDATVCKYQEDVSLDIKHSIDYAYRREHLGSRELEYKLKPMFWDIEVYNENQHSFPTPAKAERAINSISFKYCNGPVMVYMLRLPQMDPSPITISPTLDFKLEYMVFDDEKVLLRTFCKEVARCNPDIICGWNTEGFDVPYLFNRMSKLGIDPDIISPLSETNINVVAKDNTVYGLYFLDQMFLYMTSVQNNEPSYKLSYIATKNLGKDKVAYEGTLDTIYEEDISKFLEYSATDTNLLSELEANLNHIGMRFEMIKICSSTWKRAETTSGRADPLSLKYAKNNYMVCRNRLTNEGEKFSGAYVIPPNPGVHKWVVDFDFKSLYPSIICSLNIGSNTLVGKIESEDAKDFLYNRNKMKSKLSIKYDPIKYSSRIQSMKSTDFIKWVNENNYIVSISGAIFKSHREEISFLNKILTYLMSSRDVYKKNAKNLLGQISTDKTLSTKVKDELTIEMKKFETIQTAYKLLANSLYGVLGNPYFRFYNIDLAESITTTGKEVLQYSVTHLAQYMKTNDTTVNMNYLDEFENKRHAYNVYGDTDSLFVALGDYLIDKGKL